MTAPRLRLDYLELKALERQRDALLMRIEAERLYVAHCKERALRVGNLKLRARWRERAQAAEKTIESVRAAVSVVEHDLKNSW